ncbi:MAG TPA: PAS domain S-box protein [Desulfosalsimonadaceae bacterium]|nr:PAS domain S-box protein [Desulfosalsimonadaceae bacterium]
MTSAAVFELIGLIGALLAVSCFLVRSRQPLPGKTRIAFGMLLAVSVAAYGAKYLEGSGLLTTPIINPIGDYLAVIWPFAWFFVFFVYLMETSDRALKESQERYRMVFNGSRDAIFILDGNARILDFNPAATTLTGHSHKALTGMSLADLSEDLDLNTYRHNFNHKPDGFSYMNEIRIRRAEDKPLEAECGHTIVHINGRKLMHTVARDITDRKQAENLLAAEKERLDTTLYSIGDGVITTDTSGRVTLINRVAENLTGWRQSAAWGRHLSEVFQVVAETTRAPCKDPVGKVLETDAITALADHTILISRSGLEFSISDSGAPIIDRNGRTIGVVIVFRDITASRKTREEMLKIEKLESLGVLAGGIAHDFNNFLTGIMGNLSLLKLESAPESKTHQRLSEMEKAAQRATDLTQQLLTFSKGGEPVKELTNLESLIRESASFALRGSNVICEFHLDPSLKAAEIDTGQISQVISNIVINADQAMSEGGRINIFARNLEIKYGNELMLPPGSYIQITIKDTGPGIEAEKFGKVFDPYFSTKHKGSGLGLSVALSIIEKHNGKITVDAKPDKGTSFYVYLPASDKTPTSVEKPDAPIFKGRGRILVMDDEDFIRDISLLMLSEMGFDVDTAKDGNEAIALYQKSMDIGQPYDAVFMDLTVPGGMGGKETIQELAAMDENVNAIVSSGYSTDPVMSNYRAYGFKGAIKKPYMMQEMSEALEILFRAERKLQ